MYMAALPGPAIWDPRNNANKAYNANIKYYDQFKEVFQTGNTMNNIVSISGCWG
jgi:hypothetical protein